MKSFRANDPEHDPHRKGGVVAEWDHCTMIGAES
jgi:hypothetical protein